MALIVQLISLVPFRALIATSGESWFFSKRLARDSKTAAEEYERLQHEMRTWTTPSAAFCMDSVLSPADSAFVQAVSIALNIIQEATLAPDAHLTLSFGPDLALYFASLVLWAATFAGISHGGRSPLKSEDDSDPFEWEPRRAESLVISFVPEAFSDLNLQSSNANASPQAMPMTSSPPLAMQGAHTIMAPQMQQSYSTLANSGLAPAVSSPHMLSGMLPSHGSVAMMSLPPLVPPPSKLQSWRMGVGAVLRWSAFVLSGAGHRNSGAGQLVEGAIGVLEKVGRSGWSGSWF